MTSRVKVGEPGFSIAAVERGREVIVSANETIAVGNHDFTCFSIIPSGVFHLDIPDSFEGSWYTGALLVGLKDAVIQVSSPLRHAAALCLPEWAQKVFFVFILMVAPDHRLMYVSVQLSLITLFLNLDLDFLIACRTAPNPLEKSRMSAINLGFHSVGVMRSKGSDEFEASIHNCNSLKGMQTACTSPRDLSV